MCGGQHYNLILLDVKMPILDGLQVTKRFREWEGLSKSKADLTCRKCYVSVVGMTGNLVSKALRDKCHGVGMIDVWQKSPNPNDLQSRIVELASRMGIWSEGTSDGTHPR